MMPRAPLEDRRAVYERLGPIWPVLLEDVRHFATAAPDATVRCGRLEVFVFLADLPNRVAGQAQRQAERVSATNGHAAAGRREDAR
jgi:hypothetical protein